MKRKPVYVNPALLLAAFMFAEAVFANPARFEDLPVKEVTVFKDGHAFVLHEGTVTADEQGDVVMDYLPRPVMGTFWVYSPDDKTPLRSVISGSKIVTPGRTALNTAELVRANTGKRVRLRDSRGEEFEGLIIAVPEQSSDELASNSVPGEHPQLPVMGQIILLKVAEGVKVMEISSLREVTFLDEPSMTVDTPEFRNLMTLRFGSEKGRASTGVGMMYVQRGIRWIPSYRVELDGNGRARVLLQATIINELRDLEDVKAHLVIGVPSFAFKEAVDPISMRETVAQLGSVFQADSRSAYACANAIMAQRVSDYSGGPRSEAGDMLDLGPEVAGSAANDDLFIFTLNHLSLKKGQRMVVPVSEYDFPYRDVYLLDLPFTPPTEVLANIPTEQQLEMARLMHSPKVKHAICVRNSASEPITTAPAMVLKEGKVLAQGMTKYAPPGGECEIELTVAVDFAVRRTDVETSRQANAMSLNHREFEKASLAGTISITNNGQKRAEVEVRRSVLGRITAAASDGVITHLGPQDWDVIAGELPGRSYSWRWPNWWYQANSAGSVRWTVTLEPGETRELGYEWFYFWCW
jgi:hypothetical protein